MNSQLAPVSRQWLSQRELAAELGVCLSTVRRMGLPVYKIGKAVRHRREDVNEALARGAQGGLAPTSTRNKIKRPRGAAGAPETCSASTLVDERLGFGTTAIHARQRNCRMISEFTPDSHHRGASGSALLTE